MSRIFKIIFLCWMSNAVLSKREFSPELKEMARSAHEACVMFTGATDQMIQDVKDGKFGDDPAIKRYTTCLWRFTQVMNREGVLDMKKVKYYLKNGDQAEVDGYSECNKKFTPQGKDFVDTVWKMQQCLYKTENDKFIFF